MWKNKPTAVIGASPNADRYSYKATISLQRHKHTVYPIGIKKGEINGLTLITDKPSIENIDTVTLYVGPDNQPYWIEYIIALKPFFYAHYLIRSVLFFISLIAANKISKSCWLLNALME